MSDTLPLPFESAPADAEKPRPMVGRAPPEGSPRRAANLGIVDGSPHGGDNPEIVRLPPSRLDNCSRCYSDCEIAPRQREVYRLVDGTLLCRSCYQRGKST